VPVFGVAADRDHFCARTRLVRRVVETPLTGAALIDALTRLARELGEPAFLLPCTDGAVLAVSAGRDALAESYRFVLPEHGTVARLMDKMDFTTYALEAGLPIPPTFVLRSRADAERAGGELTWPAVMKPDLKTARWLANTTRKAIVVNSAGELIGLYDRAAGWADALVAQAWIEGGEEDLFSFNGYFDRDSTARATFIARKIRQWPPETGTSSLGVEVRDDVVLDMSLDLFRGVRFQGLSYLEVKRDRRTGAPFIIEPNIGRPTGRSAIAERGGVELLLTAYRDAFAEPLPEARVQAYRGVKWIYWRHDLQASAYAAAHGRLTPAGWWRSVRGPKTEAVFDRRDLGPFFGDLAHTARSTVRAVLGRRRRSAT
jgi:D-aspartate ligase